MKIKSINLHGFKSFADRTEISVHEGVTAIVGPNGCGKSNISDALRWVLGEQRPTAIRGSRMEEAIFQGTAQRKPIHRAEVALTLANEDGILAVPQKEVVIGRTVLRGGESDYQLNGASCRLKDIQDLCRDTGLGANAYSIIEARMIDAILSDRAEERRSLFEEAAEVGRYKDRRRTALRRLDQAEHDLDRLEDVLGEVRSKVRSLGRQRGRARRYEDLRERRLQLEVAVADERLRSMESRLEEAEAELRALRSRQPALEAGLRQRETEAENLRLKLIESERGRSEVAATLETTRARAEELERERLLAAERVSASESRSRAIQEERVRIEARRTDVAAAAAALRAEVEAGEAELEVRRGQVRELEASVDRLRAERKVVEDREQEALGALARVIRELGALDAEGEAIRERSREWERELERRTGEREALQQTIAAAEARLAELEETARRHVESVEALEVRIAESKAVHQELRERLRRERDRLGALESEVGSIGAVAAGLASTLAEGTDLPPVVADLTRELGSDEGILGVLADAIEAPRDLRSAVESHLGPLLGAVLVRDWKAVRLVRQWMGDRDGGEGVVLLPVDPGPRKTEGGSGGLAAEVRLSGPGRAWAHSLLADVELASGDALAPRDRAWVSPDGAGQDERGIVRLGRPTAGEGVLRRRGELSELEARLETTRRALDEARVAASRTEAETEAAGDGLAQLERELETADSERRAVESERDREADRLERSRRALAEVESRIEELRTLQGSIEEGEHDDGRRAELEERKAETKPSSPGSEPVSSRRRRTGSARTRRFRRAASSSPARRPCCSRAANVRSAWPTRWPSSINGPKLWMPSSRSWIGRFAGAARRSARPRRSWSVCWSGERSSRSGSVRRRRAWTSAGRSWRPANRPCDRRDRPSARPRISGMRSSWRSRS